MNRKLLSLSVAGLIGLVGTLPLAYAQDDDSIVCDGVLVQSRFALANCMAESAAAIAAAVATEQGCPAGKWDIEISVPEFYLETIPVQGVLRLSNAVDSLTLTGQSSAQLQNNVNCQVNTTDSENTFGGVDVTYSAGSGNFYVDAIIDKDESLLCISSSLSAGNIATETAQYEEANSLNFAEEGDLITATGALSISGSSDEGRGQGQSAELSVWTLKEAVLIPELAETAQDAFEFEAKTDDIGPCKVEIEGAVANLVSYTVENESGGLMVTGTLEVEPAE